MQIQLFVPGLWKVGDEKIKACRETAQLRWDDSEVCPALELYLCLLWAGNLKGGVLLDFMIMCDFVILWNLLLCDSVEKRHLIKLEKYTSATEGILSQNHYFLLSSECWQMLSFLMGFSRLARKPGSNTIGRCENWASSAPWVAVLLLASPSW